jgi:hypothetical protein
MEGGAVIYKVEGTSREVGAIGVHERFELVLEADTAGHAAELARNALYDAGREHVHVAAALSSGFAIGDLVELRGGFEDGARGVIVGNDPQSDSERRAAVTELGIDPDVITGGTGARPFRFEVEVEDFHGIRTRIGGLSPAAMDLARECEYCGRGPCCGSARTANGRDVTRWARVHYGAGVPERFPR